MDGDRRQHSYYSNINQASSRHLLNNYIVSFFSSLDIKSSIRRLKKIPAVVSQIVPPAFFSFIYVFLHHFTCLPYLTSERLWVHSRIVVSEGSRCLYFPVLS